VKKIVWGSVLFLWAAFPLSDVGAQSGDWQALGEGISRGEFYPPNKTGLFRYPITVLRIDPKRYAFKLLSASERGGTPRTAEEWCTEFDLLAVINASMYLQGDPLKSTGYMRNYGHINNPHINPAFGAFMVFNPVLPSRPEVRIVDRHTQEDWKDIIAGYHTVVQNYRMITNGRKVGWFQGDTAYRTAAVAMDWRDQVLFILSRSPFSTHDLIQILLSLPIGIRDAMYVEGGLEASLYYKVDGKTNSRSDSNEKDSQAQDAHGSTWAIPNVIGISERR
jgi:hypothetical protein